MILQTKESSGLLENILFGFINPVMKQEIYGGSYYPPPFEALSLISCSEADKSVLYSYV